MGAHAVRINVADNCELDVLCAHFGCDRTDIYVAVAMVGDRLIDVRRYLTKVLESRPEEEATSPALEVTTSLLPAWSSAAEASGGQHH